MWKDLEGFLSHASFSNKHGDAEIPMANELIEHVQVNTMILIGK